MGKGNLLQGMGRGKLGDTVFYRQNGSQMFRVRNRIVKNPKSTGQQIQRSIMATVTKAYSQLQVICNHSFENVAYGAASQSYFVKKNLDLLRKAAVTYSENNLSGIGEYNMPYIVAPGTVATVCPNKLIISEGSLQQTAFGVVDGKPNAAMNVFVANNPAGNKKLKAYLEDLGNKMYTLVVIRAISPIVGTTADKQGNALWNTEVLYSRIKRNDVVLSEEDAEGGYTPDKVRKYITIETNMKDDDKLKDWFTGSSTFTKNDLACCVIASAWNGIKWLRSTERLSVNLQGNIDENKTPVVGSAFGLDFAYGLGLWTGTIKSLATSDKLLNGGKFEADTDSIRPVG